MQIAHRLGLSRIWMQPGSESEAAIEYCHAHDMQVVFGACAMVHAGSGTSPERREAVASQEPVLVMVFGNELSESCQAHG